MMVQSPLLFREVCRNGDTNSLRIARPSGRPQSSEKNYVDLSGLTVKGYESISADMASYVSR